jgi:hypothetical protein
MLILGPRSALYCCVSPPGQDLVGAAWEDRMTKARSTLTLARIAENNGLVWTRLQGPIEKGKLGGEELEVLRAGGTFKVGSNKLSSLDGLEYKGSKAHFSITGDDGGEWTYFHLTLVGGDGRSAYFELQIDDEGELDVGTTSNTVFEGKLIRVSGAKVWSDPPSDLRHDVRVIIAAMVGKSFKPGEAI